MLLSIELLKRCLVFPGTGTESKWADTVRDSLNVRFEMMLVS